MKLLAADVKNHPPDAAVRVTFASFGRFSVAPPLLFNRAQGTAMLRLTVLLIVVTLTGLPVLPAACLTWCGEHRTTTGNCHDEAVKNGLPVVTASATCTALPTDGTFIREEARPVPHAVHTLPAFEDAAPLAKTPALASHHRGVIHAPLKALLVLRV